MDMALRRGQGLNQILKGLGLGTIIIGCAAILVGLQQTRLASLKSSDKLTPEIVKSQAIAEKTHIELWKTLPTYGYDNLFADWVFLRFLQYFGDDDARKLGDYRLSPEFFEIVINHDPWFREGYYYLSTSSSLYAGMPDHTVAIMNQGLATMSPKKPQFSYYLWRMKAIDEQLFLGNIPDAIRSYLKAAEWASYYTDEESKSIVLRSQATAAFLVRDPRSIMAKVTAWSTILGQAKDKETRLRAIAELEKIGVAVRIDETGTPKFRVPPEILEKEKEALHIK